MAVPGSGEISLGKIRQELQAANYTSGPYTAASTSLDLAENGTYATINTCSPYYPLSANPANMSEWYGYDHDAPCPFATASFYFDGGDDATDKLQTRDTLQGDPYSDLQADIQDKFVISMWVAPWNIDSAAAGHAGYQRLHGFWRIKDDTNGYIVSIGYVPNYSFGNDNYIEFVISAGSGSTNQRSWTVALDDNGDNYGATGISSNDVWNWDNPGQSNANRFVHLVFQYDSTQSANADKFKVYWNGTALKNMSYNATGNGGPSGIAYNGDQYMVLGQHHYGGLTNGAPGIWYGWIGWFSYKNGFAASSTNIATLYNSGSPPDPDDITQIGPDMIHYRFGSNASSQNDYNGFNIILDVTTADWDNNVYP